MPLVVITGGIGTGKSTVLDAFAKLGANCLDTDEVAHALYEPGAPAYQPIHKHFGDEVLREDGTLDRRALATKVFRDPDELAWLNALIHPLIQQRMLDEAARVAPAALFVAVPLWYEVGWELPGTRVIATWCTDSQQRERLRRRGWDDDEINRRIHSQLPKDEKLLRAHFGILTIDSLESLYKQCEIIYNYLKHK
ncbi:MAG: dephospho-CoA kinase [Victivallales bacterium]|nr:dephospho-CoA kinase [Victivallales bacterium]